MVFYNYLGEVIAYSEDGCHIYLFNGTPIAYIDDDSIYSFKGKHLGWFKHDWILDHEGRHLLFIEGARGGPVKPVRQLAPVKGLKQLLPLKGLKELKPLRPITSLEWSPLSIENFFQI